MADDAGMMMMMEDLQYAVKKCLASMSTLAALSAGFLGLAVYCRLINTNNRGLRAEDYLLISAWVCNTLLLICQSVNHCVRW
jgi:hypothetical protein